MDEKKSKKLLKALEDGKIVDEKSLALYQILDDASTEVDRMSEIKKEFIQKVDEADTKIQGIFDSISEKVSAEIDTKVSQIEVEDGKDYVLTDQDKSEIAGKIRVPVAEKIIEKTEVIREQPIVTNEVKEVAIPETPEQTRDKLESLKEEERLDKSAIKGLEELEKNFNTKISSIPRGGGARGIQLNIGGAKKGIANYINLIAGSGVAITYSAAYGRNDITISASGAALSILTATGTINDSNKAFTFVSKPNVVIVNGASYQENKGWSWNSGSLTATLDYAVGSGGDIYGI